MSTPPKKVVIKDAYNGKSLIGVFDDETVEQILQEELEYRKKYTELHDKMVEDLQKLIVEKDLIIGTKGEL
jgi:adenosine/AMP kinase